GLHGPAAAAASSKPSALTRPASSSRKQRAIGSVRSFAAPYVTTPPFEMRFLGPLAWLCHGNELQLWRESAATIAAGVLRPVLLPLSNDIAERTAGCHFLHCTAAPDAIIVFFVLDLATWLPRAIGWR